MDRGKPMPRQGRRRISNAVLPAAGPGSYSRQHTALTSVFRQQKRHDAAEQDDKDGCCVQHQTNREDGCCPCLCCVRVSKPLYVAECMKDFLRFFRDYVCDLKAENPFVTVLEKFAHMKNESDYKEARWALAVVAGKYCDICADILWYFDYPIDVFPRHILWTCELAHVFSRVQDHMDWLYRLGLRKWPRVIFDIILNLAESCDLLWLCRLYGAPDHKLAYVRFLLGINGLYTPVRVPYCGMSVNHHVVTREYQ